MKDAVLDRLAETVNVAQFVSFGPGSDPPVRHARLRGTTTAPHSLEEAIDALLQRAPEESINVRSFLPEQTKSNEFVYGLKRAEDAIHSIRRLAGTGFYTIANETIDVHDGGVSGVAYGGIVEFAPDDTPRCVEKPGTASIPLDLGLQLLETVYGFAPALDLPDNLRVEFSIHPLRRGVRDEHTIVWEEERSENIKLEAEMAWPNRFSRHIGDKTFGLLIADVLGLPVPHTTAVSRRVAPFTFGQATGSGQQWLRTAPAEQQPGRFTTRRGWMDPFELMTSEDPSAEMIAAVLSQEGVEPLWSGAAALGADDELIIEGVAGAGEAFMAGAAGPEALPKDVTDAIRDLLRVTSGKLGPARCEWVHDGERAWIVQLHEGRSASVGRTIYPGAPSFEHEFQTREGLEALRVLVGQVRGTDEGVILIGDVGVTSHLGDILRRARIPSRLSNPANRIGGDEGGPVLGS